jgi:hypothetical protein
MYTHTQTHTHTYFQALGRDVEVESKVAAAKAAGMGGEGGLRGGPSGAPLTGVDLQLARQEYLTYGQQVRL